jgi:hypothetical protein
MKAGKCFKIMKIDVAINVALNERVDLPAQPLGTEKVVWVVDYNIGRAEYEIPDVRGDFELCCKGEVRMSDIT